MSTITKPAAGPERKPAVRERKAFQLEVKEITSEGQFSGYAAVFGNVDSYEDVIQPGAFAKTLQENGGKGWPLLWQHWTDEVIGLIEQAQEDQNGLYVVGQLNLDVQRANEAYSLLKQGAVRAMSIGYQALRYQIDETSFVRTLLEIKLWETSLVTFPANELALVSDVKTIERALRDAGADPRRAAELLDEMKALLQLAPPEEGTRAGGAADKDDSSSEPGAPADEATLLDAFKAASDRALLLVRAGL